MVMAQGRRLLCDVLATAATLPSTPHPLLQTDAAPHSRPSAGFRDPGESSSSRRKPI